jgi:hypothetical protein
MCTLQRVRNLSLLYAVLDIRKLLQDGNQTRPRRRVELRFVIEVCARLSYSHWLLCTAEVQLRLRVCYYWCVRFQVLITAIKMAVFWDGAPCRLVDIDRRFGGAYCLQHHETIFIIDVLLSSDSKECHTHNCTIKFNCRYIPDILRMLYLWRFASF